MKDNRVVCYGEVLWDEMPDMRRVGGAPLNVCYHLNRNGVSSQIVSQVGEDADGQSLLESISSWQIDTGFVGQSPEYPTSRVEVQILEDGGAEYEIVEQVAWDYMEFQEAVAKQVDRSYALVFGSLVARSERSRATLYAYLERAPLAVYDVNLRPPFYDRELILGLIARCHILKVNNEELDLVADWIGISSQSEEAQLRGLLQEFPQLSEILLSKGSLGARYFSADEDISVPAPRVRIVDTIGSGDAFLAGFLSQRIQGRSTADAVRHAVLLSAYVATQSGACPDYTEDLLLQFEHTL